MPNIFRGPTYKVKDTGSELWFVGISAGYTVIQAADGSWFQTVTPTEEVLKSALRFYRGGYTYTLTDSEVTALTSAGYGSYITVE